MSVEFTLTLRMDKALGKQLFNDLPIIAPLLDRAAVPGTLLAAPTAFGGDENASPATIKRNLWRAREAFNHLRELGLTRRIPGGLHCKGWVWEKSGLTDGRGRKVATGSHTAPRRMRR